MFWTWIFSSLLIFAISLLSYRQGAIFLGCKHDLLIKLGIYTALASYAFAVWRRNRETDVDLKARWFRKACVYVCTCVYVRGREINKTLNCINEQRKLNERVCVCLWDRRMREREREREKINWDDYTFMHFQDVEFQKKLTI